MREESTKEVQMLRKYGWYAHLVPADDPQSATGFNYHTHGFERVGHHDLQIVFPMAKEKCHGIATTIYRQVKEGTQFQDGDETRIPHQDGSKFPVRFIKVKEGDREVLRVIVPNPNGEFEPKQVAEDDKPEYALQWTVTTV